MRPEGMMQGRAHPPQAKGPIGCHDRPGPEPWSDPLSPAAPSPGPAGPQEGPLRRAPGQPGPRPGLGGLCTAVLGPPLTPGSRDNPPPRPLPAWPHSPIISC